MNGWQAFGFRTYQEYLDSPIWKSKANYLKEFVGFKCQECNREHGKRYVIGTKLVNHGGFVLEVVEMTPKIVLHVHHKSYKNVGNEDGDDLIVLCQFCHQEHHNNHNDRTR